MLRKKSGKMIRTHRHSFKHRHNDCLQSKIWVKLVDTQNREQEKREENTHTHTLAPNNEKTNTKIRQTVLY